MKYYTDLGIKKENLRFSEQPKEKLAHYAKRAVDIEYNFPFGWHEIEGIHYRGDWDLSNHSKHSKTDLSYLDPETSTKFMPHIIETSAGCDRSLLALLIEAFNEFEQGRNNTSGSKEFLMNLDFKLSPIKVAVFPLMKNKEDLVQKAREIYDDLKLSLKTFYDESGSIGKRYRRQDEIGTPYCVTVDFDTLEDKAVTLRNRDDMSQKRIPIEELKNFLKNSLC